MRIHIELILAAGCLLALTGCPNPKPTAPSNSATSATKPGQAATPGAPDDHAAGVALSLFQNTPMLTSPPDAISFSHDCGTLWLHGLDRTSGDYYAGQFKVGSDKLEPGFYTHGRDLIVSYAASSPDGDECLVESQQQPKGQLVRDVIYRVGNAFGEQLKSRSFVPYLTIPGIPAMKEGTFTFTKPFYSWDGKDIIIPFNGNTGIALVDKRTGIGRYVAYPKTKLKDAPYTAFQALPNEGEARRIWASFWNVGSVADQCELYTLDLQSLKWEKVLDSNWAVFNCAAPEASVQPWLVSGSYSSYASTEKQVGKYDRGGPRLPRAARIAPGAGTQDLVITHGEPVWDIALDPLGKRMCFMDFTRNALVRLSPADGKLDIDTRWFTTEHDRTKLFISAGGDRCFVWQGEILIEGKWSQHDDQKGYDE